MKDIFIVIGLIITLLYDALKKLAKIIIQDRVSILLLLILLSLIALNIWR